MSTANRFAGLRDVDLTTGSTQSGREIQRKLARQRRREMRDAASSAESDDRTPVAEEFAGEETDGKWEVVSKKVKKKDNDTTPPSTTEDSSSSNGGEENSIPTSASSSDDIEVSDAISTPNEPSISKKKKANKHRKRKKAVQDPKMGKWETNLAIGAADAASETDEDDGDVFLDAISNVYGEDSSAASMPGGGIEPSESIPTASLERNEALAMVMAGSAESAELEGADMPVSAPKKKNKRGKKGGKRTKSAKMAHKNMGLILSWEQIVGMAISGGLVVVAGLWVLI